MGAIVAVAILAVALGALIWWGSRLPPTRPRPGSRHRGHRLMDVDRRLEEEERRRRP